MASPYNTRLVRSNSANPTTDRTGATSTVPRRHFCIALTNNPRMIQTAQLALQNAASNAPVSIDYIDLIRKK